jgi:uncharacterized protein with GYD domain
MGGPPDGAYKVRSACAILRRAGPPGEFRMAHYLTRAKYSSEAFKGMIANPHDRGAVAKKLFESAGMALSSVHFSPSTGEIVCIADGDGVKAATVEMVVMGSGMFTAVESIELISTDAMLTAMKRAAEVAAGYRPTNAPK